MGGTFFAPLKNTHSGKWPRIYSNKVVTTKMTYCVFCKSATKNEPSREHIFPESMGNSDHVLPPGTVCHTCNQYFARNIDIPLLESPIFRYLRAGIKAPSERGRFPVWSYSDELDLPGKRLMGRFLGKVGLGVLALKTNQLGSWSEDVLAQSEFDELRNYVRFNQGDDWPFIVRTLCAANAIFDDSAQAYKRFQEFDMLITDHAEYFSVVSIFGVEFSLNIGGRSLSGFNQWMVANNFASPLCTAEEICELS